MPIQNEILRGVTQNNGVTSVDDRVSVSAPCVVTVNITFAPRNYTDSSWANVITEYCSKHYCSVYGLSCVVNRFTTPLTHNMEITRPSRKTTSLVEPGHFTLTPRIGVYIK